VSVLFVQMLQFHMHIGHAENASEHEHVVDVHFESISHASHHESIYETDFSTGHSSEISVSHYCVMCGLDVFKNISLFILVFIIAFHVPRFLFGFRQYLDRVKISQDHYLLNPPLRAPPFRLFSL
jgi:hypothetical protein